MPEFFEYDPVIGVRYDFEYDDATGEARFFMTQDVEPLLDFQKALRNDGLRDKGIKEGWWHYASIPVTVMVELKNKGLDVGNPKHADAIYAEINTNYPHLKATQKNHGGKVIVYHDLGKKNDPR